MWDFFTDIQCITVENSARINEFKNNLIKAGFNMSNVNINVYPKIKGNNNMSQCNFLKLAFNQDEKCCDAICQDITRCHFELIQNAYNNNKENILIFEDDARFIFTIR